MGFFVYRHLGLLGCNIVLMKRILSLFILTGLLLGQDGLFLKSGKFYKGRYVKKVDELIVFQVEGDNHFTPFPINDVAIIKTRNGELTYPFDIPTKQEADVSRILDYRPKSKIGQAIYGRFVLAIIFSCGMVLAGLFGAGM